VTLYQRRDARTAEPLSLLLSAIAAACGPAAIADLPDDAPAPLAECSAEASPVMLATGTSWAPSFQPDVPTVHAGVSGSIVFEDENESVWLAPLDGDRAQLPGTQVYETRFSLAGRWLVVPGDDEVRVLDEASGAQHRIAEGWDVRPSFYRAADGSEAVALYVGGSIWVVDDRGPRAIADGAEDLVVADRGAIGVTDEIDGHRVVDLDSGEVRRLALGTGVVGVSHDGAFLTHVVGRDVGDTPSTMSVIDTSTLEVVAQIEYSPLEGGYYRAPMHAPSAAHTIAFALPGGGVTILDDELELQTRAGGELLAILGRTEAVLREGDAIVVADAESREERRIEAVGDPPGGLFDESNHVASRGGMAVAFTAEIGGAASIVMLRANEADVAVLATPVPESGLRVKAVWIGDDGTTLVQGPLDAAGDFDDLHLVEASGSLRASFAASGYDVDAVVERANLLLVRVPGYPGELIEIDLATATARRIGGGDAMAIGDGRNGCHVAISLGCARPTGEPDSYPLVDWELYRLPLGGPASAPLDPCVPG